MNAHGNADEEHNDASKNVCDGVERGDEWRAQETAVDRPVEGDGHETVSRVWPEQFVDDDVLRGNPANPTEERQSPEDPAGEPVVDEADTSNDKEQLVSSNLPAICLGRI